MQFVINKIHPVLLLPPHRSRSQCPCLCWKYIDRRDGSCKWSRIKIKNNDVVDADGSEANSRSKELQHSSARRAPTSTTDCFLLLFILISSASRSPSSYLRAQHQTNYNCNDGAESSDTMMMTTPLHRRLRQTIHQSGSQTSERDC